MSARLHLEQLGRAFGLTLEELAANQRGELHPAQRARVRRQGLAALVVLLLLAGAALGGGLIGADALRASLGTQPSQSDLNAVTLIRWAGVLLALALCAGAASVSARRRKRTAALAAGRIEVLEGPLDKRHISGRGIPDRHIVRVRDHSFDVPRALSDLLTQGATYRLYFVADQLLSFAPVLDDPLERAEYQRELAQFERTRNIGPSRLV